MKKTFLYLSLASLIGSVSAPTALSANDFVTNWMDSLYVSTFVGGHFLPDIETDVTYTYPVDPTIFDDDTYNQETGFAARLALGGHVNRFVRSELELGFSRSNQGSIVYGLIGGGPRTLDVGHGEIDFISLMANAWIDLPLLDTSWGLTPYVGGGIGAALVSPNLVYTNTPAYGPQESSVELAAQLGAGVNWAFNDRFSAGVGYRFMVINGPEISQLTDANAGEITTYRFDDLLSHSVGITLTMNLN
ncbi:MAG: outer membrane protein [Hyphomicrobiales bacterium]